MKADLSPRRSATKSRWFVHVIRVGVTVGLLAAVYVVAVQAVALRHFRRGSPDELRRAIRLDPRNAEFYAGLARTLEVSLEGADPNEVIHLYESAARLSPERARHWAELGGSYEWAGRQEEARRAFERARNLFPHSPDINWKLGNFYLRAGKPREFLRAVQETLRGDAEMRRAAFDLAWRAGLDNRAILAEMITAEEPMLLAYLNFLSETKRLDAAGEVWARLREIGVAVKPQAAFPYLDALIQDQRVEELEAVWATVMERRSTTEANRLTNGSFEDEILNGGLDWRITPAEGAAASVDTLTFFDGTHSLRVRFDGTRNVEYAHARQYVPAEPQTLYRLSAYLRAQGISSDMGPQVQVCDAQDASQPLASTESATGTFNWTLQQLKFKTGPTTRLLVIRLARPRSRKLDGRISGTVWVDRVSLVAIH